MSWSANIPWRWKILLETPQGYIAQHHTILRFLADAAPAAYLYGETPFEQAQVDKWLDFSWSDIEICLRVLECSAYAQLANVETILTTLAVRLNVLNEHLATHTFLVGQRITIADVAVGCACLTLYKIARDRVAPLFGPHVFRWMMTFASLPAVREVMGDVADFALKSAKVTKATLPVTKATASTTKATASTAKAKAKPAATATAAAAAAPKANGKVNAHTKAAPASATPEATFVGNWKRQRIRVKELLAEGRAAIGKTVTIKGWLRTARAQDKGRLLFVEVNDGSSSKSIQVLLEKDVTPGFDAVSSCGGAGASVSVTGTVVESPATGQEIELQTQTAEVIGAVYGGDQGTIGGKHYPLAKKAHGMEYLRSIAHLRPRSKVFSAAMRIRHAMAFATHKFFNDRGFCYVHTPIVTAADCEGAGEQFAVTTMLPEHATTKSLATTAGNQVDFGKDFFGRRACLTVSGQLNVETHACALSDCYTFGPTFRAENSHTSRHLSEFWMIEPEICFADLYDNIDLAEDYLKFCVQYALENCADDLEYFESGFPGGEAGLRERLRNVLENRFVRITYTQGVEILERAIADGAVKFENSVSWGVDLASEHERYITEQVYKMPVVMTNYPKEIKAFYMRLDEDERTVAAMDILVPKIGEIMGGSQREERLEVLERRCREMNLDPASLWWYLDLRRYGTAPHAGFGLGFERLIMFVTGLENIRDVIPFPRAPGLCEF